MQDQAPSGNKLFVGNLSWSTNIASLQSAFGQFGQVVDATVMRDRDTGRSRGFGFITFSQPGEAQAAIVALDQAEIDGRPVRVNYATSQSGGDRSVPRAGYNNGNVGGYGGAADYGAAYQGGGVYGGGGQGGGNWNQSGGGGGGGGGW